MAWWSTSPDLTLFAGIAAPGDDCRPLSLQVSMWAFIVIIDVHRATSFVAMKPGKKTTTTILSRPFLRLLHHPTPGVGSSSTQHGQYPAAITPTRFSPVTEQPFCYVGLGGRYKPLHGF